MAGFSAKYRIGPRLGGGGMAEVFRGVLLGAEGFTRTVVIKRVLPGFSADPEFASMFVNEARVASLLLHPNIVSVIDFDRDDQGQLFLVMELVDGKDLRQLCASGRLEPSIAAFVALEVLKGLAYAHRLEHSGRPLGIVHRDMSPHNVLLSWDGSVKLTDFGIAKAAQVSTVTQTGVIKGKAAYLSPEQAEGSEVDARTDLFAVGIMLHEMLTGRRLFGVAQGAPDAVIVHRVLRMDIPAPSASSPAVSKDLEAICLKLLERDPRRRFQEASEAVEALLGAPEASARAQRELSKLMRDRFPSDAPTSGQWPSLGDRTSTAAPAEDPVHPMSTFVLSDVDLPTVQESGSPIPAAPMGHGTGSITRSDSRKIDAPPREAESLREKLAELDAKPATRRLAALIGLIAVATASFVALELYRRSGLVEEPAPIRSAKEAPEPAGTPAAAVPTAGPPKPVEARTTAVDLPDKASIKILSTPSGAAVYLGSEATPIGTTPLSVELPRGTTPTALLLRAEGHEELRAELVPDADRELELNLAPKARPNAPAVKSRERMEHRNRRKDSSRTSPPMKRDETPERVGDGVLRPEF